MCQAPYVLRDHSAILVLLPQRIVRGAHVVQVMVHLFKISLLYVQSVGFVQGVHTSPSCVHLPADIPSKPNANGNSMDDSCHSYHDFKQDREGPQAGFVEGHTVAITSDESAITAHGDIQLSDLRLSSFSFRCVTVVPHLETCVNISCSIPE
jgi:hypothetical protein